MKAPIPFDNFYGTYTVRGGGDSSIVHCALEYDLKSDNPSHETSMEGGCAACDVRVGSTKQVASAVGEGATAAFMIRQYLEQQQGSIGYKGG